MSDKPRFNIGDHVWRATFESVERWVSCPDCGGTKTLAVELFDGTRYTIDCVGCAPGLVEPRGVVCIHDRVASPKLDRIVGVRIEASKIEYSLATSYCVVECDLFKSEADAQKRAAELAAEHDEHERRRALVKHNENRNWAWHVHYYRRQIKDAQKTIEHATARLHVALEKATP